LPQTNTWRIFSEKNFPCAFLLNIKSNFSFLKIIVKNTTNNWTFDNSTNIYNSNTTFPVIIPIPDDDTIDIGSIDYGASGDFNFELCNDINCNINNENNIAYYIAIPIAACSCCFLIGIAAAVITKRRKQNKKQQQLLLQNEIKKQLLETSLNITNITFTSNPNIFLGTLNGSIAVSLIHIDPIIYINNTLQYTIRHPNWLQINGVFHHNNYNFVVAEKLDHNISTWLDTKNLKNYDTNSLDNDTFISIGLDIAKALACAETAYTPFDNLCIDNIIVINNQIKLINITHCPWTYNKNDTPYTFSIYCFGMVMLAILQWTNDKNHNYPQITHKPLHCSDNLWTFLLSCIDEPTKRPNILNIIKFFEQYKPEILINIPVISPNYNHYIDFNHYSALSTK
jgi:hypothetical protein